VKLRFSNQRSNALTLTEVLVVLVVIAVLALILIPASTPNRRVAQRNYCINNLKNIGVAFRVWMDDGNYYPMAESVKRGGVKELVATGNVAAVFQVMSNELVKPKLLICPADAGHHWATNFTTDFGNKNISYLVGLDANDIYYDSILVGDDNFELGGVPLKSGVVQISTNTPIAWTGERHSFIGNIALADGSVQTVTISGLTNAIIKQLELMSYYTNRFRFAIP
jgi:prepilin-type N-terminal cleavage/methylation domain-containing protein